MRLIALGAATAIATVPDVWCGRRRARLSSFGGGAAPVWRGSTPAVAPPQVFVVPGTQSWLPRSRPGARHAQRAVRTATASRTLRCSLWAARSDGLLRGRATSGTSRWPERGAWPAGLLWP